MSEATEFGYRRNVLLMRLLVSAGLTAAAMLLWSLAGWSFSGFDAILGALATAYFGSRVVGNIYELVVPRPVIRVSDAGLQDRRLGSALIPWSAITEIKEVTGAVGAGTLFLEVREPKRYIGPTKGLLWLVYALRARSGQSGFLPLTPPNVLDLGDMDLLDAVDEHCPREIPVTPTGPQNRARPD